MKILVVDNEFLDDKGTSTLYDSKFNEIKKHYDYVNIMNIDNHPINDYDVLLLGARAIHLYKKNKLMKNDIEKKFNKLMCIKNKYMLLQDMHQKTYTNINTFCNILNINYINIIFTFFNNHEANTIKRLTPNVKHFHIPMHIDINIFYHKPEIKKEYDILIYGAIHPNHYPFRNRLVQLITNSNFNYMHIKEPEVYDSSICNEGLCNYINKSKIAIATKSKYNYFVAKYLEISACNTLIAGNIPTDAEHILKDNMIELTETMKDEEIISIITNVLNNYEDYNEKKITLNNIIKNNFSFYNFINKLNHILT